jgi:hypothetical protein
MGVGANTYAEHEDVERLIGDIVESRTFTTGTVPSLVQVETELDNAAAELNNELDVAGYTVPVNATDYPTARAYLKAANAYGAAAVLLATIPALAYDPEDEVDAGSEDRGKTYNLKFKAALKAIQEHRFRAGMRVGRLANVFTGAQEDEDGNAKEPFFKRGMDDYPGVILNGSSGLTDVES